LSYLHIPNLFADNTILLFKEVFALEKVDGTSSSVSWRDGQLRLSPGGCKLETFVKIFNQNDLIERFRALGHDEVVVFGEQYGGKMQGMSATYGKEARFVAFEVKVGDTWLAVPNAEDVAHKLGLEFVHYTRVSTDLAALDAERDADSVQAVRNGMGTGHKREGVVLRPIQEFRDNRGNRVIAKHKRAEFSETKTPRKVGESVEPTAGELAAAEWVTDERMRHVVDHVEAALGREVVVQDTGAVVVAMIEDVIREAGADITDDRPTRKAVGAAAGRAFKAYLTKKNLGV